MQEWGKCFGADLGSVRVFGILLSGTILLKGVVILPGGGISPGINYEERCIGRYNRYSV